MPTAPDPPQEFEEPKDIFEFIERVRQLKSFWKTRRAVLNGEALHTYDKSKLGSLGLLGPWRFNIVQSSLSTLPAIVFPFLFHAVISGKPKQESPVEHAMAYFDPFVAPFALLIVVFFVGFVYARARGATSAQRACVQRQYLYLDGAYGLFPQMLCSIQLTGFLLFVDNPNVALQVTRFWLLLAVWQFVITFRVIPEYLFLDGEPIGRPQGIFDDKPRTVPWLGFSLAMLIGIPVCCIVFLLIAYLCATMVVSVVHLVSLA